MTKSEQLAMAILRGGRSYQEAAEASGIKVQEVIELFKKHKV